MASDVSGQGSGSGKAGRAGPIVHADLMRAIREGRFVPGTQLPNERQLAEHYGTSRQQVRDVLLIMQEAGLVHRRVGSGTWLSADAPNIIERLDADVNINASHEFSFHETIEARLVIEPGVAALAAQNLTDVSAEALGDALEAVRQPMRWLDYKSRVYLFARAYYAASGNAFLLGTFDRIIKARQDHKFDGQRDQEIVAEIVRRHSHEQLKRIHDAILARDTTKAEAVTRDYLLGIAASSGST